MVEGEGEQSLHLFDASMVSVFRERREGRRQEGVEGWRGGLLFDQFCIFVLCTSILSFLSNSERFTGLTEILVVHTRTTQESATRAERAITSLRQELLLE